MPTWFTELTLLSETEDAPCMVVALLNRPSCVVDELLFVRPFWVVLAPVTAPICTVVDELPAWAADDRAKDATETMSNLRMEYRFLGKMSDAVCGSRWHRGITLNALCSERQTAIHASLERLD